MYTAAKMGCGNMVLMLPQRGKDVAPDKYTEVWKEVNGADSNPPPPMLSGNFYIDESADYAEAQGRTTTFQGMPRHEHSNHPHNQAHIPLHEARADARPGTGPGADEPLICPG